MNWLAQSDRVADARRFTSRRSADTNQSALMLRGSIIADLDFTLSNRAPCKLISYVQNRRWNREFTLFLNADLSLSVEVRQGPSRCYARLADADLCTGNSARLTYSWNSIRKVGLLSLNCAESGNIHQAIISAPIPVPGDDAASIVAGPHVSEYDPRIRALALSNEVVPVGPAATIAKGGLVKTTQGFRAIERLQMGDLVLTQGGKEAPVRCIIKQEMPAVGASMAIRLRAPFFGLTRDLVVSGDQRVLISDGATEYNFGREHLLIEARNLIGHPGAEHLSDLKSITYYQILLDSHECIRVSGAGLDTLYVANLVHTPDKLAATALSQIPIAVLPAHPSRVHPTLREFERRSLLDTLTA